VQIQEDDDDDRKKVTKGGEADDISEAAVLSVVTVLPPSPPLSAWDHQHQQPPDTTWTATTGVSKLSLSDVKSFAKKKINGREVKMLVRAAQAIAKNKKRPLDAEDIRSVIKVHESVRRPPFPFFSPSSLMSSPGMMDLVRARLRRGRPSGDIRRRWRIVISSF
jgi:hypothetical protein